MSKTLREKFCELIKSENITSAVLIYYKIDNPGPGSETGAIVAPVDETDIESMAWHGYFDNMAQNFMADLGRDLPGGKISFNEDE